MHQFSIFTPTHNRAQVLPRLYDSLKRQTYKDFVWVIVDDGSSDNTKEVVDQFINESIIDVEYYFIENGFKQKAFSLFSKIIKTPYFIDIDDDDELTDNCLQVFKEEWDKVSDNKVGEIRALSLNDKGEVSGNYLPIEGERRISNYIQEFFVKRKMLENVTCRKKEAITGVFDLEQDWLYDKVTFVYECVFWLRQSLKWDSLYLNIPLRIYHDSLDSMTVKTRVRNLKFFYNTFFSYYHILNSLSKYSFSNILHYTFMALKYSVCGFALKLPFMKMMNILDSNYCKFILLLFSPVTYLYSKCLKIKE